MTSPLTTAAALATTSPRPLVIDVRPAEQFARGQIPGAVHLDLWGISLIDTDESPLRAFAWMIAHLFALRGVDDHRAVVVYEQDAGMRAARAFWWLEYLGHRRVQVLDGGYAAWAASGQDISTEPVTPTPTSWQGAEDRSRVATWQDVRDRLESPDVTIVDARSAGEYRGDVVRARRGGRIPGAVHVEWKDNLREDGHFKSTSDLRAMYAAAGVAPGREVVTYCQGGYRAAHAYLALRILGFPRVRNYTGSWKEWGDREDLPAESGGQER